MGAVGIRLGEAASGERVNRRPGDGRPGRTQPATRDPDRRTYMINHLVPVRRDRSLTRRRLRLGIGAGFLRA